MGLSENRGMHTRKLPSFHDVFFFFGFNPFFNGGIPNQYSKKWTIINHY